MILKTKLGWRFLFLGTTAFGCYEWFGVVSEQESYSINDWILLLGMPFIIYIGFFLVQTLNVWLSDEGIKVTWKIGFGKFKLWEQNNYYMTWDEISSVYSIWPQWFPFHLIGVSGSQSGMISRIFYVGALMTEKKKALPYIADRVAKGIIDEQVEALVRKYRKTS